MAPRPKVNTSMLPIALKPLPYSPPVVRHLFDLEITALFDFPTDKSEVIQTFLHHCSLLPSPPFVQIVKNRALLQVSSSDSTRQYVRWFNDFCDQNFSSRSWKLTPQIRNIKTTLNRDFIPAWILSVRHVPHNLWSTFTFLSHARFMKFITPLQFAPRPAQRSLTFNPATPLQPAINLAQAARLSQDVDSQIPTSKTTPSPRDSPQQTPAYSPDGGSPPLTPQQKNSDSETQTLPFKQQRTRSPPPDPFDEDESPHFPHETLSPFSQHKSSSRPVSPEPAPKHHRAGSPSPLHV